MKKRGRISESRRNDNGTIWPLLVRRQLFVPQQEATLVLVDQEGYKMRLYERGKLRGEYGISRGQGKGQKRVQGDNKTPTGMYFVLNKHRGKFGGAYGGNWIKVNYPHRYDAERGRAEGLISAQQQAAITANWQQRKATLENTRLGAGMAKRWPAPSVLGLRGDAHLRHPQSLRSDSVRSDGGDILTPQKDLSTKVTKKHEASKRLWFLREPSCSWWIKNFLLRRAISINKEESSE
ncbi:MAG: L,D-transpeptidase family protein [Acidobacteria bacterium]|nr:L,D-transpeptidase family protein [Acidobacteriota bacterium]